jgi:arabinofuranosyltransferase
LTANWHLALGTVIVGCLVGAYLNRFVQDDAFITFRYADNWLRGEGLVYNPGEPPVEGYSNFLWLLLMAGFMKLGVDPVLASQAVGLVAFAGTLVVLHRIGTRVLGSPAPALLVCLFAGTNYTFSIYATGGLETQLQVFLVLACFLIVVRSVQEDRWERRWMIILSLLFALTLLTRPDSALLIGVVALAAAWRVLRSTRSGADKGRIIAYAAVPCLTIVGGWLAWKLGYYGEVLPNTYYAKTANTWWFRGWLFLELFTVGYLLIPALTAVLMVGLVKKKQRSFAINVALVIVVAWCFYVVRVGGGFMEFRMLVPMLPFFFLALVWALGAGTRSWILRTLVALITLGGSIHHAYTFEKIYFIWDKQVLSDWVWLEEHDLVTTGRRLGALFDYENGNVTIAMTPAGATPYHSRLRTIDMYGLNDRWIAKQGAIVANRPGHQRFATFQYLLEQRVTLLIGTPRIKPANYPYHPRSRQESFERRFRLVEYDQALMPETARIVLIPINEKSRLTAIYLTQNDLVDSLIRSGEITSASVPYYGPEGQRLSHWPTRVESTLHKVQIRDSEPLLEDGTTSFQQSVQAVPGDPPLREPQHAEHP